MHLLIHVTHPGGLLERDHHTVTVEHIDQLPYRIAEWTERLNADSFLCWTIEAYADDATLISSLDSDEQVDEPLFYMLAYEGYKFNSQLRDNVDILRHKLQKASEQDK